MSDRDERPLTEEQKEWQGNLHRIWWMKKKELNLTQQSAALACGWSAQGTAGQYINGQIPLNLNAVVLFANLLEVPIDEIAPNSSLTKALSIAVRHQSEPKPETSIEEFKIMLSALDHAEKRDVLKKFTDAIGEESRSIVMLAIAEAVAAGSTD